MMRTADFIAFNADWQDKEQANPHRGRDGVYFPMVYLRRNCRNCGNEVTGADSDVRCDDCQYVLNNYTYMDFDEFDPDTTSYGHCSECGYPLSNWGAASDGDGDLYDEIGCDACQEVVRKIHAETCECVDCLLYRGEYYATEAE